MKTLINFFKESAPLPENRFVAVSNRFKDADGNPMLWEIRAVTYGESEDLQKDCMKRVKGENRKGTYESELDKIEYMRRLLIKCVVYPNLNDAELQNSYGVMGADDLVRDMLSPGEFVNLINQISALNSLIPTFTDELNEMRELLGSGDYEAEIAYFCLSKFNVLPSQLMNLPLREQAFIVASIEKMLKDKENP